MGKDSFPFSVCLDHLEADKHIDERMEVFS